MTTGHMVAIALACYAGGAFMLWGVTWVLYLSVMGLKRAQQAGKLTGATMRWGGVVLVLGLVFDAALNWLVVTPLLLHVSPSALVTGHLGRLINRDDWRGRRARYLCSVWLDPFDPDGCHCRAQS